MATSSKKSAASTARVTARKAPAKWSQHVTETSDAMDLKPDVFKFGDATEIAKSVKTSAEHSDRRKAEPFRSAMSMLNFYINRAGHNLKPAQHRTLEKAKDVLRELFGRPEDSAAAKKSAVEKTAGRAVKKTSVKKTSVKKPAAKKTAAKKTAARDTAKKAAAKRAGAPR